MIYILFVSWVVTTCVVGDSLRPILTQDLKSIVDAVKKDVDRHLKLANAGSCMEYIPDSPGFSEVVSNAENGKDYKNFLQMIEDSMNHHLVMNLGQPYDENGEQKTGIKPEIKSTLFTVESASEQLSGNADEGASETSSQAKEIRVGSSKAVPGVDFPDYTDIPITSFTCSSKSNLPGFYADLDTGCQVFHVCWPDRRESFLCPMGTIFNQTFKVCDYWYNSNCSLAPYYYTVNAEAESDSAKSESSMINILLEKTDSDEMKPDSSTYDHATSDSATHFVSEFLPIKVKIAVYPKTETRRLKIVTTASIGKDGKADFKRKTRQKNLHDSNHSRVPRSVEYAESTNEQDIRRSLDRIWFRFYEALDRAVIDIENDEEWSKLSGYARQVVDGIKSFSLFNREPEYFPPPEPGSTLFEEDMQMKGRHERLREVWKWFIILLAKLKDDSNRLRIQREASKPINEREDFKPEPLTNLNPKFIVKPAEQVSRLSPKPQKLLNRVKNSKPISNPLKLSHEGNLNIHPETKKILLKNYVKLFKIKHKHS